MNILTPGITRFMYENEEIGTLDGAISLPIGARVERDDDDYIVDTARVSLRGEIFDLYYEVHMAETVGSRTDPRDN